MPSNLKTSMFARNVQLNALAAAANHGWLRIYTGTQPTAPESSVSTQVCLCELRLNKVAFLQSQTASLTANPINDDMDARASGRAAWYRVLQSDGVTALWDGSVGTKDADLIFNSVDIQHHAKVSVMNFTYSIPQ